MKTWLLNQTSDQQIEFYGLVESRTAAQAVAAARAVRGISQKQLAQMTGIDQSDISKIERGTANPSISTLERIAKALGGKLAVSIAVSDGK